MRLAESWENKKGCFQIINHFLKTMRELLTDAIQFLFVKDFADLVVICINFCVKEMGTHWAHSVFLQHIDTHL